VCSVHRPDSGVRRNNSVTVYTKTAYLSTVFLGGFQKIYLLLKPFRAPLLASNSPRNLISGQVCKPSSFIRCPSPEMLYCSFVAAGIFDIDHVVESFFHNDECTFVYGSAEDCTAIGDINIHRLIIEADL
jgi:hypothetical protein